MTTLSLSQLRMYSRAFKDQPEAMRAFLAECKKAGIAMPSDDGSDDNATEPAPTRYDGKPGDSEGKDPRWRSDDSPPKSPGGPVFRTKAARERFQNSAPMPAGPVRGADGKMRFYASSGRR